ncbi:MULTISPECIES: fluoride efflux transporter CrcB [Ochrobactrum]|uniref:Fluoride-specific ion channel FluC n=1 Tax=Ochrobactrum chromiisoli TaxID=2993941 RepID=A0ABT3QLN8_9HYPH|nr:fluoride efflux transporter CrcB [Ochrobactrum chromiisoli]MCX2696525.1 fluoride efflux transporter CrcB [Ochrobactrum chromiisoli]
MQPLDILWVGLGGGLGSLFRWWVGKLVGESYNGKFPLGTFLINVSGAFVIGFLSVLFSVEWYDRFGDVLKSGILTGILGGYTTFSSMQLDAVKLARDHNRGLAIAYLVGSVLVGLSAAAFGALLASWIG